MVPGLQLSMSTTAGQIMLANMPAYTILVDVLVTHIGCTKQTSGNVSNKLFLVLPSLFIGHNFKINH